MKQIIIIGGGPAGIAAAQNLSKGLSDEEVTITLIEKRTFFFHALGSLRAMVDASFIPKILIPYDNIFQGLTNVHLKFATVNSISYDTQTVNFTAQEFERSMSYDYLILATGSSYPAPIKPADTVNNTLTDVENALKQTNQDIESAERILIIGGGAVGIEMAGEIKSFYPNKKVMLLDSHDELLSNNNVPKLRGPVKKALTKMGVELLLGQRLKMDGERLTGHEFETKTFETEKGMTIESDARIICAGMKPNTDLMDDPECLVNKTNGTFIKVTETMEVAKYKNVFVLGDASDHPTPKLAYWALMQGAHLAKGIIANIRKGTPFVPYSPPSAEALFLPLGPKGGKSQLPMGSGIIVGNFLTKKFKSKDLITGMFWKMLNVKMP